MPRGRSITLGIAGASFILRRPESPAPPPAGPPADQMIAWVRRRRVEEAGVKPWIGERR